jgi:cytochrome b involved in lipid metabolism
MTTTTNQAANYLYVFEGKVYNLKDWIPIHPGGSMWFSHAYGRDITTLVYCYHKNPELCKRMIEKYVTTIPVEEAILKKFNVPDFILPPTFDA